MDDVKLLNVIELSHYLRVHRMTIYRLLKSGELPAFKVEGKYWRVKLEVVDHWRMQLESSTPGKALERDRKLVEGGARQIVGPGDA
jgi:excisionase family DNA binding protein